MVATLAQAASAAYYLESQRSFRHPNEYYTAGEEPDGVWFNPKGLFGLEDGGKVDSGHFHRLYHGFAPDGSGRLTRNAGSEKRSPGLDLTFSADKSVSALWAIADPDLRSEIEQAHNDAARVALEETVFRHCACTRIRNGDGQIEVLSADIAVAMFQHGTSRDNDPQLHTHCVIFNAARTRDDGRWRAMHQHPVYGWAKAAGAVYRNTLAWNLHRSLGLAMEQYGRDGEFTRIKGVPEDLAAHWSKRRAAIVDAANDMGFKVEGNAARAAAANKITRAGKSSDNDPEVRHRRWRDEAESFYEREALIAELLGKAEDITQEQIRELTAALEMLPERLTREEAVFRLPDVVERVSNATAGLLGREAVATSIERVMRHPELVRLTRIPRSAEGRADMAHTRLYTTGRTLEMEQALRDMAEDMAAESGHALPAQAIEEKIASLMERGYPLSEEQAHAIRTVACAQGRVAIVEGAAGSGKTTTLRPIADLCREHGGTVIATAVAWRTAVALGNDLDARPFCVDKLLKLAARDRIEIDDKTVIVVDEAGMLSTRQAHHVLRLAERNGARVVFAGDTRQQQPVEAGPGLRLIRDAVGSVRVDRIRRQKPDLEDILVHVHGETPSAARFRGGLMGDDERARILSDYEAMAEKPALTPWQVDVSGALRDGNAADAIQAWQERGRLHLAYTEERTLKALVDDWDRYTKQHPEKSAVVLARTRAEVRALSHLMRGKRFARHGEADGQEIKRVTVTVSRGTEDDRTASALEIAVGDRLRIGATHWEKQLFNGTVVTVEDLAVRHGERRPGGRGAGTEARDREPGENEPSVLITARTDDGRQVSFRHDEIRDWYGNIRLDHGYALTIAAAQGLTVDKTFLLADDRPARETIYPAATRHREEIDVYVNRAPLALDVADRRADSDRDAPVLDSEIRAHLAERWSRSVPKEAALDYMAVDDWEDQDIPRRRAGGSPQHDASAEARPSAANDNTLVRIARDVRRTAFAWRHGAAVDAFAAGRQEVLASWDDLRQRTRSEGDAVALSGTYRETLDRHGALLRQAEPFRARPEAFAPLLAERVGIRSNDLDEFGHLHDRARRHRKAATMRQVHRQRREAERRDIAPEMRRAELTLEVGRAEAPPTPVPEPPRSDWRALYKELQRDWNALVARSQDPDLPLPLMQGYDALIGRIRALAEHPGLSEHARGVLDELLEYHEDETVARETARGWLADAERHIERWKALERRADEKAMAVAGMDDYRAWREAARTLAATGETVLGNEERYGAYLDALAAGKPRARLVVDQLRDRIEAPRNSVGEWLAAARRHMEARSGLTAATGYPAWRKEAKRLMEEGKDILSEKAAPHAHADGNPTTGERLMRQALSRLGETIGEDDRRIAARKARARRERLTEWSRLRFADEPAGAAAKPRAGTSNEVPEWAQSSRPSRAGQARFGGSSLASLERWQRLKRQWNRQLERAGEQGVHVIYTKGFENRHRLLRSMADDPYLETRIRGEIGDVLRVLEAAQARREHVETTCDRLLDRLERRRENLELDSAWDRRPIPDREGYGVWRNGTDEAVAAAEDILADPKAYSTHLDGMKRSDRAGLDSALSRVRKVLREDDRHIAETLAGRRKGEDVAAREEGIAHILDDPKKLRELRRQYEEHKRRERRHRKGRYQSRSMRM